MKRSVLLCCVMLCYVTSCHVMLSYVILCFVMLCMDGMHARIHTHTWRRIHGGRCPRQGLEGLGPCCTTSRQVEPVLLLPRQAGTTVQRPVPWAQRLSMLSRTPQRACGDLECWTQLSFHQRDFGPADPRGHSCACCLA